MNAYDMYAMKGEKGMFFKKDETMQKRLEALEEQIDRLEEARAQVEPGSDTYDKLTQQLDGLYKEKENHLTPWHKRPEGKAMLFGNIFSGAVGIGLATFELWAPHVGKTANHVIGNFFRNSNRRA